MHLTINTPKHNKVTPNSYIRIRNPYITICRRLLIIYKFRLQNIGILANKNSAHYERITRKNHPVEIVFIFPTNCINL